MTPFPYMSPGTACFVGTITHPVSLVVTIGLVFGNTAIWTLSYSPTYLPYSSLWSVVALIAALAAFATVRWVDERLAVATGAVITITAVARALANLWASWDGDATQFDAATLRVAAGLWLLLALLVYAIWLRLVIPWVVFQRRRSA